MFGAVDMGPEHHPVRQNFAQRAQRENLKTAAVRQDRPRPVHEGVETAQLLN